MSTKPNDGGPAFPNAKTVTAVCPDSGRVQDTYIVPHGGMSLRDWFAGQALAGMCGGHAVTSTDDGEVACCRDDYLDRIASTAYSLADAMLAAREDR